MSASTQTQAPSFASSLQAFNGFIASGQKFTGQVSELYGQAEGTAERIYAHVKDNDGTYTKIALAVGGIYLLYQNTPAVIAGVISVLAIPAVVSGATEKTIRVWNESAIGKIGVFSSSVLAVYFAPWAVSGTVYGAFVTNRVKSATEEVKQQEPSQSYFSLIYNTVTGTKPEKIKKIE